jgi:uncharacterized membrane protein
MANKSSRKYKKQISRGEPATISIIIALILGSLAYYQNKYGQFSDIRGFYGLHFSDGQHQWPFSHHSLLGSDKVAHPVEYPALTGLIMWLISFLVEPSNTGYLDYYKISVTFNILLFAITTFLIKKLTSNRWAVLFAICPAVLYSLNRNWDIWAVLTMIWAIILFERKNTKLSAVVLAVSIAFKFFPIVLLLPIAIIYFKKSDVKGFFNYAIITFLGWLVINLPFALINFRGWSYFYEFNFQRGLGSASIFEIINIYGIDLMSNKFAFYFLNILIFTIVTFFLLRSKNVLTLAESSFFVMFAFILFNKQYSMQYIIWLTALAVVAIAKLLKKYQVIPVIFFVLWQILDLLFQYAFFQKILTGAYANSSTPVSLAITDSTYGIIGLIRYLLAVVFFVSLMQAYSKQKREESHSS